MKVWPSFGVLAFVLAISPAIGYSSVHTGRDAKSIEERLFKLRSLPDDERAKVTKQLALEIRQLPAGMDCFNSALELANLTTEGDFGRDTLQAVTDTLVFAVSTSISSQSAQMQGAAYDELAQLSRLEGMRVTDTSAAYKKALRDFDATERHRAAVNFTLTDLSGKKWTLSSLKGKVVLVNFWATWCPPCRKEMPDLNTLYAQFKSKGFVILAISDEKDETVRKFIDDKGYSYPVLLDPGRKVNTAYSVGGIPKSFLYNRQGKLVGETIDMRTKSQFLTLLKKAGLE